MCGITGIVSSSLSAAQKKAIVEKMNALLAHRGPDNDGTFGADDVCFGHRRLSIIDLSADGNQPFNSEDGRYSIIYNGELYNYRELKLDLQRAAHGSGHKPFLFRTESDTEVMLAAYIRWGKKCLDRLKGMYAFAVYDRNDKTVFIARDRFGVKPLYYYYGDEGFVFASEIRAITGSGIRKFSINKARLAEYAMYQTVFAPQTIVKEIKMLMPGHYIELREGRAEITRYYDVRVAVGEEIDYRQTCQRTFDLLSASVSRRMIADVPFGAFLSGGIDSTAVVALMSAHSSRPVSTFNITFDEEKFSEAKYARIVAAKYNTEHHEIRLTPSDFLSQLPEALAAMDHPGGDGPNTYVVSKAARNAGITMALSGIGGDELFAGYDVFRRMTELRRKAWLNSIPRPARKVVAKALRLRRRSVANNKISELLAMHEINFSSAYPANRSLFTATELRTLEKSGDPFAGIREIMNAIPQVDEHLLSAVSIAEIRTYLQNTLLRDTDQMSMAVALEVREPFLDHELVEFVLGVRDEFKMPVTPKKLLVDSMGDLLPHEIVNRPKMGFTLPWSSWLANELRSFCETHIRALEEKDLFEKGSIRELWKRFLSGDVTVTWSRVWHLVVLDHWIEQHDIAT